MDVRVAARHLMDQVLLALKGKQRTATKRAKSFGPAWWTLGLTILGLLLVVASLLCPPPPFLDPEWWKDVLLGVGTSLFLFGPFFLATRGIDRHLNRMAEAAEKQIEQQGQLDRVQDAKVAKVAASLNRLEQASAQLTEQVEAEAEADRAAIAALRTEEPTREVVTKALTVAQRLGLVDYQHRPRVLATRTEPQVYVAFEWNGDPDLSEEDNAYLLSLAVQDIGGNTFEYFLWKPEMTWQAAFTPVISDVRLRTDSGFEVSHIMKGLADLFEAALSHEARRPAIQLCPPQWMVSGRCAVTTPAPDGERWPLTDMSVEKITVDQMAISSMRQKTWVDENSWDDVCYVLQSLYPPETF